MLKLYVTCVKITIIYSPVNPDLLNPKNGEYAEFFDRRKVEEMDLSKPDEDKNSSIFYSNGEETVLYFW